MLDIKSLSDDLEQSSASKSPVSKTTRQTAAQKTQPALVITQLTSGVRDTNRVNVFVDHKFAFSLDVKQIIDLEVKVGKQLTPTELQNLRAASEFGKLYQRALEWVLTRPRSLWETRDYLRRRQLKRQQLNTKRAREELKPLPEIASTTIDLVIERLVQRGYVDDYKFATYYVENRFTKKGISKLRLSMELHKKGITEDVIAQVLADTNRNETDELTKMLLKKRNKYTDEKLIAYLVRQGFNYELVKEAVAKFPQE